MSNVAVILAGGKGTRLRPYTISLPKPLVPIGEIPILEILINQLAACDFKKLIIAVNHLADIIKAFFGDGKRWDVEIIYSYEKKSLSTIGPLSIIKNLPEDFLILNGDILTDLDFNKFFNTHIKEKNIFTVAAFNRKEKIDYGVIKVNNSNEIVNFSEKPEMNFDVSMGIYAANRKILDYIPYEELFGFDHLMHKLIREKNYAKVYKYSGYWLDIGRPDDYEKAEFVLSKLKI